MAETFKTKINPNFNLEVRPWWCLADVQQALFNGSFGVGAPANASILTRQIIDNGKMEMRREVDPPKNCISIMYFEDINNSGVGGHVAISVGDGTVMTSWDNYYWNRLYVNDFINLVENAFVNRMAYRGWSRFTADKSGKIVEVTEIVKNENETLKKGDYAKLKNSALFDWNHVSFDKSEPSKAIITVGDTGLDSTTGYRWIKPMLSTSKYFMHDFDKVKI